MSSQSTYRYIQIDSTYRNRTLYPLPSDFVIPVNTTGNSTPPLQSTDPVSLAYPIASGTLTGVTSTTVVQLATDSSSLDNFYTGRYLSITQAGVTDYRMISSYVGSTKTATVGVAFSFLPLVGSAYTVRPQMPIISQDTLRGGPSQNTVTLGSVASSQAGAYDGQFVYITSGPDTGSSAQIVSYAGPTKKATLAKPLPAIPAAGDLYDTLAFSRENSYPLIDPGTTTLRQPVCYALELLALIVPNQPLLTGYGGTFRSYPYLLLHIYNEGSMHASQTLYSNSPHAHTATFMVPIGLNLSSEGFFNLRDAKTIQTIKLVLTQPLRFRITFPDGSPVQFVQTDNISPQAPNPLLQFSASFSCRRIDQQFEK